ncbi:cytochrome P450 4C1-like [Phymastichus coffea]|uniref:cytochrome P450 4C1-like n=1 Tax=Phymastichus coffea TaxID=108790 RepID=UPI00273C4A95|nr:cytochrome P450 4C1-like [Phymastichus coffea]
MIFAIILILTALTLLVIYKYIKYKKNFDLINRIPGPSTYPIIGNMKMLNVAIDELWNVLRNGNKQYYPMTRYWLGPNPFISLRHPDDLEFIFSGTKHLEKGFAYKFMRPWMETGLLTSTGNKWHHRRKILTPAFHFNILKKYAVTINERGRAFVEYLKNEKQTNEVELMKLCTNHTLNIVCDSVMGVALDNINEANAEEYRDAVTAAGNIVIYRSFRPFIPDWILNCMKIGRTQQKVVKTLHTFTNKVLKERTKYHDNTENKYLADLEENNDQIDSDYSSMNNGKRKKLAMLDLLIKANKDGLIDEQGIREELDTFTFAGHETTGMALMFTLILLAEHNEIQDKVRAEIKSIINKNECNIKTTDTQELCYLERCIKESLRIFPPVHTVTRLLEEDACIRGYNIPKGTEIGCFIVDTHRDPNFWPEPMRYDPDRFISENTQGRHPFSYVPFSAGPRNCIAQKFAMLELKSTLAHILHNFKLEPVTKSSDIKLILGIIARPSKPVYVKFVKIHHNY